MVIDPPWEALHDVVGNRVSPASPDEIQTSKCRSSSVKAPAAGLEPRVRDT